MLKRYFFLFLTTFFFSYLNAQQSCYEVIESNTGLPILYDESLGAKACELESLINDTGDNGFDVMGCDFYPVFNSITNGVGFQRLFDVAIAQLNETRSSYAMITKEHQRDGQIRYRTYIKFPVLAPFDQLNISDKECISRLFEESINSIAEQSDFSTPNNSAAEAAGIQLLIDLFLNLIAEGSFDSSICSMGLAEIYPEPVEDGTETNLLDLDLLGLTGNGEEDGARSIATDIRTFVTPAGELIKLPIGAKPKFQLKTYIWAKGTLSSFQLAGDDELYLGWWNPVNRQFLGYAKVDPINRTPTGKSKALLPYYTTPESTPVGTNVPILTGWMDEIGEFCEVRYYSTVYTSDNFHVPGENRLCDSDLTFSVTSNDQIGPAEDFSFHPFCNSSPFRFAYSFPVPLNGITSNLPIEEYTDAQLNDGSIKVVNNTNKLLQNEIDSLNEMIGNLVLATGTEFRIFVTDYQSSNQFKSKIRQIGNSLQGNDAYLWIDIPEDNFPDFILKYGPGLRDDTEKIVGLLEQEIIEDLVFSSLTLEQQSIYYISKSIHAISEFGIAVVKNLKIPKPYYTPGTAQHDIIKKVFLNYTPSSLLESQIQLIIPDFSILNDASLTDLGWAGFCGMWNGLIDNINGIFEASSMFGYWSDETKRAEMDAMFDQIESIGLFTMIVQSFKDAHDFENFTPTDIAHQLGKDAIELVLIFVPVANATKFTKLAKVINVLDELNIINQLFNGSAIIIRKAASGTVQLIAKPTANAIGVVIGSIEKGLIVIGEELYNAANVTNALLNKNLDGLDRVVLEASDLSRTTQVGTGFQVFENTDLSIDDPNRVFMRGTSDGLTAIISQLQSLYGVSPNVATKLANLTNASKLLDDAPGGLKETLLDETIFTSPAIRNQFFSDLVDDTVDPNDLTHISKNLANLDAGKLNAWEKLFDWPSSRINTSILTRRIEFDDFGPEWIKINPHTTKEMFDAPSGGYVVQHTGHNVIPGNADNIAEFHMAESFARDNKVVKLLNETQPPGIKTPDAEIDGFGIFDFKNIGANATNIETNVMNKVLDVTNQADNLTLNLGDNVNATVSRVNQGISDAISTADNGGLSLPNNIGVVYSDGTNKILTVDEFRNGARF